jgi:hypothetical protein
LAISSVVPNYADLLTRTIFVFFASLILDRFRNWCACNPVGISFITWNACAHSSVVPNCTVSKSGTLTRIHTFFISARKCWDTIWVSQALILLATDVWVWIWFEVREACADSSVILCRALGINATLFKKAWINTFSVQAGL